MKFSYLLIKSRPLLYANHKPNNVPDKCAACPIVVHPFINPTTSTADIKATTCLPLIDIIGKKIILNAVYVVVWSKYSK